MCGRAASLRRFIYYENVKAIQDFLRHKGSFNKEIRDT